MADARSTAALLSRVPLFRSLSNRQLETLAKSFVERDFEANREIVGQGQTGQGFFIVVSGRAQAVRERADGNKAVVNEFGPGNHFGELALLDDGPRTASVIALEQTRCLVLSPWSFLSTLKADGEMAVGVLQEMARRFRLALDAM